MKKLLISFLFFLFVLPAYTQTPEPVSEQQAIEIAMQHLIDKGLPSDWFGGQIITRSENGYWLILFDGKPDESGITADDDHQLIMVSPDGRITSSREYSFTYP